jgi:putative aldouronate transport system substrate-binding protein
MLKLLDYLAAPFGSEEGLLLDFGVEGSEFTYDDKGNPVPTQKGIVDTYVPWKYISQHPQPLYDPKVPAYAKQAQDDQKLALPNGIQNPVLGYYSATNGSKGTVLSQAFYDTMTGIVTGRQPLTDFDQALKDWQNNGGNTIRQEYQDALGAAK